MFGSVCCSIFVLMPFAIRSVFCLLVRFRRCCSNAAVAAVPVSDYEARQFFSSPLNNLYKIERVKNVSPRCKNVVSIEAFERQANREYLM